MPLEYIVNNQLSEVEITEEDLEALLLGGKDSKIVKFSGELGVRLNADRSRYVVVVQGSADKIKIATDKLNQFLKGGDG
jgi:hypothetical protein